MSPHITVHRSTAQHVLGVYAAAATHRIAWRRRLATWAAANGVRDQVRTRPDGAIIGIVHPSGADIPDGWRQVGSGGTGDTIVIAPYMRSRAGKALANQLGALRPPPDVRKQLPGIAHSCLVDDRVSTFRPELREQGTALYAVWDTEVPPTVISSTTIWRAVPLSAYYRLVESEAGRAAS